MGMGGERGKLPQPMFSSAYNDTSWTQKQPYEERNYPGTRHDPVVPYTS
jgi:hypothetical protein